MKSSAEYWDSCDRIFIEDLLVRCVIGTLDWERVTAQDVIFNILIGADLTKACQSDQISDTIDYKALKKRIMTFVEGSSFFLVEKLAECVAVICLDTPGVDRVQVRLDKPGALRFARSVGVEICRVRGVANG